MAQRSPEEGAVAAGVPAGGSPPIPRSGAELPQDGLSAVSRERAAVARPKLPPHRGKLTRIQDSAQGAIGALREWVDLRIELVKAEVQDALAEKQAQAKAAAVVGLLAALAGLMLLLALGFGAGALFEALLGFAPLPALAAGFGLVMVILAIVAGIAYVRSPLRDAS